MTGKQLETVKAILNTIDGKLKRLKEYVDAFDLSKASINQLKARQQILESLRKEFEETQYERESLESKAEFSEMHANTRIQFENEFCDIMSNIADIIDNTQKTPVIQSAPECREAQLNLPILNLTTFSGNYKNWTNFENTFISVIDENVTLNNRQKLQYLKSSLQGEALRAVESLSIDDENYDKAWDILRKRFKNTRLIVQDHVFSILNAPSILKSSYTALRELHDTVISNIAALKTLKIETDKWDALLVPIIAEKLDFNSKRDWQASLDTTVPTYNQFINFLNKRCTTLESLNNHNRVTPNNNHPQSSQKNATLANIKSRTVAYVATNKKPVLCVYCKNSDHNIIRCPEFVNLTVLERNLQAKKRKLCLNCLRDNHLIGNCRITRKCHTCNEKHHTLLHVEEEAPHSTENVTLAHHAFDADKITNTVLLSTAIVAIKNSKNEFETCRALLDQGSMSNYISRKMCDKLGLHTKDCNIEVKCLNGTASSINKFAYVDIKSKYNNYTANRISCLVVNKITDNIPLVSLNPVNFKIPANIQLADPLFYVNGPIDLLLGASLFYSLLCVGQITIPEGIVFQKTHLGFIAGGSYSHKLIHKGSNYVTCNLATTTDDNTTLESMVSRFWELESSGTEAPKQCQLSEEELLCEKHFTANTSRQADGRFVVKLPTKNSIDIGETKPMAIKRFYNAERKFTKDLKLKIEYSKFMKEYISLNHMRLIREIPDKHSYLPHHAVFKSSSTTTKIRVVFDASAKSSNQKSLNDNLLRGPVIQRDLFSILIEFRTYLYTLNADLEKMYRQILIHPSDSNFQLILWRDEPTDTLETYQLQTLTYGTKPASFLATRCLKELATINSEKYPRACQVINNNFYMDDLLVGADSIQDLIQLRDEIIHILKQGQFNLRKFQANDVNILPKNETNDPNLNVYLDKGEQTKILGLCYNPSTDVFTYDVDLTNVPRKVTKRIILSLASKIFDPLGLIGPITIKAKFILQELWTLQLSWDESVPTSIHTSWTEFVKELGLLNSIKFPRSVKQFDATDKMELHAFCDASQSGYGAAIYLRSVNHQGKYETRLICAKSRVAPLKTITLPRLELCGALLLARLINKVRKSILLSVKISREYLWTDSSIVLAWINTHPSSLKTFVANRISEITSLTNVQDWKHIKSEFNAADILSRGAYPAELIQSKIWFFGPSFLSKRENEWPKSRINISQDEIPERRTVPIVCSMGTEMPTLYKFSKFCKLQRVMAWVLRFINNCKTKDKLKNLNDKLSVDELENSTTTIIHIVQRAEFFSEWTHLSSNRPMPQNSKLLSLNPFLDDKNIIRVGGRIRHAQILNDAKHPILLPKNHFVTKLLIKAEHERQMHAGPQATLAGLRQSFWAISGRSAVRQVIHHCQRCFKIKPEVARFKMGDLPSQRVTPARPFIASGCDLAGPVLIRETAGRGKRLIKAYIVMFICFATKAIHIELVTDLTTNEFLGAFKRFTSRRGHVRDIYSDNATNFVGAKNELEQLFNFIRSHHNEIHDQLANLKINWHFIPARSPHMGGLWEANIKSIKRHLKAVIGNAHLTYSEMYTVLVRIEACLNSRPLTPLTSDPNDLQILTPGHFLVGEPLTAIPEYDIQDVPVNKLSRWQLVERIRAHFWSRWSREYLSSLQQRSKWFQQPSHDSSDLKGAMVLLVDDSLQPLMWKVGRIEDLHPGDDGHVRVVSVRTNQGIVKRSLRKVCLLPLEK